MILRIRTLYSTAVLCITSTTRCCSVLQARTHYPVLRTQLLNSTQLNGNSFYPLFLLSGNSGEDKSLQCVPWQISSVLPFQEIQPGQVDPVPSIDPRQPIDREARRSLSAFQRVPARASTCASSTGEDPPGPPKRSRSALAWAAGRWTLELDAEPGRRHCFVSRRDSQSGKALFIFVYSGSCPAIVFGIHRSRRPLDTV